MADEKVTLEGINDTVTKGLNKIESDVKAAKEATDKIATDVTSVKGEVTDLKAWQVSKDEADKKNQQALDELISKSKKPQPETKSFQSELKRAIEEKTDEFAKMAAGEKSTKNIVLELKTVGDIVTGNVTGTTVWGAISRSGIIEKPKRNVHMRQVMVGGAVGSGTDYYFMKQNGDGEGSIAFTAETATKPQKDFDLVESSVKIETLAGWSRVSRKAMNNIPGFTSFLNSRLVEALLRAEDEGVLYGDGSSPNIKGILASGNFTASSSTATVLAEKIIDDIATLEDTHERMADLVLLRPQHYYGFFKNKAAGSGEYDLPKSVAFSNGSLFINGVLCLPTTALAINTTPTPDTCDYVVGDFGNGAQFLTQEGMRIEFFYEDGTNVRENKVTVRIEETVALPVFGDNYFIKGTHDVAI